MQLPRKMSGQNINPEKPNPDTGNREHKATGNEIRFAGDERKDKLYEPKHKQKLVRVLTVVAYVIFVSMGAILLSLYYTFVWDPKDVPIRMRTKPECVDVKSANPIVTPTNSINETQIKRMEAETVTNRSVQTGEPKTSTTLDIATPRKDLLTVILRATAITSSILPLTAPDLRINPRTESSRERFANTSPGIA